MSKKKWSNGVIPMRKKDFIRLKRRLIKQSLSQFYGGEERPGLDGSIMRGAAYLPKEAYLALDVAHRKLYEAHQLLKGY
jgi:hypothetical protein